MCDCCEQVPDLPLSPKRLPAIDGISRTPVSSGKTPHNQWIFSHTRSLLPALQELATDYHQEIRECIEALYLDPNPSYFLEEVPPLWRCAHLEALMNPEGNLAQFQDYQAFYRYTEEWQITSANRAAIAALDNCLMTLRAKLLQTRAFDHAGWFPLERQSGNTLMSRHDPIKGISTIGKKVGRELRRGIRLVRKRFGLAALGKKAA